MDDKHHCRICVLLVFREQQIIILLYFLKRRFYSRD